jgi:hypothetical protein
MRICGTTETTNGNFPSQIKIYYCSFLFIYCFKENDTTADSGQYGVHRKNLLMRINLLL